MSSRLTIGARLEKLTQSEIRSMTLACSDIGGINLAQGVCDLPLPAPVEIGAKNAISDGINSYTRFDGLKILREAIAEKTSKFNNIDCDPEKNIVVSSGSTGVFYWFFCALFRSEADTRNNRPPCAVKGNPA